MDHIVHYDQLDEAWVNKKLNSKEAEYLRQSSPLIDTFSSLRVSIPVINLNAPQGTAIFQTFEEYQHSTKSNVRTTLQEKYRKSIKQLTNKIGGMGKNCSEDHPEQKPSSKHSFCFL